MNTDRWFYLAVAALIAFVYIFSSYGRDRYIKDGTRVFDKWTGSVAVDGKILPFGRYNP